MFWFVLENSILWIICQNCQWKCAKIMERNGNDCIYCFLIYFLFHWWFCAREKWSLKMCFFLAAVVLNEWLELNRYRAIWCISLCRSSPRPRGYNHSICMLWRLRFVSLSVFFLLLVCWSVVVALQFIYPEVCADFFFFFFFCWFWYCGTLLSILDIYFIFFRCFLSVSFPYFRFGVCFVCNTRIYLS